MHQQLADSTFRIVCGNSSGTGFSFISERLVVTNHHVIEEGLKSKKPILVITESNATILAELLVYSNKDNQDFAILQLRAPLPPGRKILQPAASPVISRGERILFSGFPHGIPHLLVHEAIISAPLDPIGFYIDGSINGGNSGGPIVSAKTGEVIGIITQKRFIGGEKLDELAPKVDQIVKHCEELAQHGRVIMMGLDFGAYTAMVADGFSTLFETVTINANTGIGIGFNISFAENAIRSLKRS